MRRLFVRLISTTPFNLHQNGDFFFNECPSDLNDFFFSRDERLGRITNSPGVRLTLKELEV